MFASLLCLLHLLLNTVACLADGLPASTLAGSPQLPLEQISACTFLLLIVNICLYLSFINCDCNCKYCLYLSSIICNFNFKKIHTARSSTGTNGTLGPCSSIRVLSSTTCPADVDCSRRFELSPRYPTAERFPPKKVLEPEPTQGPLLQALGHFLCPRAIFVSGSGPWNFVFR